VSTDPKSKQGSQLPLSVGKHLGLRQPEPYAPRAAQIAKAVLNRRESFAPLWKPSRDNDPGVVLAYIFGDLAQEVGERIRELPEKARIEHLRVAGIGPRPATPAQALVVFEVTPTAQEPVVIPQGFRLGARPASGDQLVVFETERTLLAAPGKIAEVWEVRSTGIRALTPLNEAPETSFQPFGLRPRMGDALYLGLDGEGPPGATLTLGIGITRPLGAPIPASEGGVDPLPTPPGAELAWEILDGTRWLGVEPVRDETSQLGKSGVIELKLPDSFLPGHPPEVPVEGDLRWLRLRIVSGSFPEPPALDFVRLNAVFASAGQTVRDEVLTPVSDEEDRLRLAHTPIHDRSLMLEVDSGGGFQPWTEVDELSEYGAEDEVFVLDRQAGEVTFGDGLHGKALPRGFRHVRARTYRWGGGAAGAVKAEAIKSMLGSITFVSGVSNPRPSSGGDDGEPLSETARRGPELIRAHGRAVLPSDYELLALSVPGARVRRIHAMPGRHPQMRTALIPGVVGLLVVPPAESGPQSGPPTPDEQTLRAVARHVSRELAPAGVEIVAAAPVYHSVRIEAQVRLAAGADRGAVVTRLLEDLDGYLHPLKGGDEGTGWPFGGALRYDALVRRLLQDKEVVAVPRLSMVVDGRRVPLCQDREIGEHDLLWPEEHLILPLEER